MSGRYPKWQFYKLMCCSVFMHPYTKCVKLTNVVGLNKILIKYERFISFVIKYGNNVLLGCFYFQNLTKKSDTGNDFKCLIYLHMAIKILVDTSISLYFML